MASRRPVTWVPLRTLGSLGPLPSCAVTQPTLVREYLFLVAVGTRSLWVASPGVMSQLPSSPGRFLGRRPLLRSTVARGRSPLTHSPRREVVSGPAHQGCPPHGFWASRRSGVVLAVGPAVERQSGRSLFGMPARGPSRPLCYLIGLWVVALLVTLFQRGCNICFMSKDSELTRTSSNGLSRV